MRGSASTKGSGPKPGGSRSRRRLRCRAARYRFRSGRSCKPREDGEEALVASVLEAVGTPAASADLFAGIGTFALALPGKVLAAEASRDAVLALKRAAPTIDAQHRDLYRRPLMADEMSGLQAVVLDPPRSGAEAQVVGTRQIGGAADRLCQLQSRDLCARCGGAGVRRLPARLDSTGRAVSLVDPCRAGRRLQSLVPERHRCVQRQAHQAERR